MDDGVESFQVSGADVAQVECKRRFELRVLAEVTAPEVEGIEADDVVTGVAQRRSEHRPDVAVVSGHENSHGGGR